MKLLMFSSKFSDLRFGAFINERIIDLVRASEVIGIPVSKSIQDVLIKPYGMLELKRLIDHITEYWDKIEFGENTVWEEYQIQWFPPVYAGKIICVGLNYKQHVQEVGIEAPADPTLFSKVSTTLIGHQGVIPYIKDSNSLDYEAELAVIIGKKGKCIQKEKALEYIAGYSCFNDVTVREYQFKTTQWMQGKNFDGHGPLGPMLITPDEVEDISSSKIILRLNGKVMQQSHIGDMIFDVPTLIETISRIMTLNPGDVISTGTPAGVGFGRNPKVYMQCGDVVEVEITQIGKLRNFVK